MMTTAPLAIHPERILRLNGGCNFRDLGGYRTRGGHELRWRRVYRTGVLSYFTADDQTQLRALRVRAICDLRRSDERAREPTQWPAGDLDTRHLNWDDGKEPPTIRLLAAQHPNTAAGMRLAMMDLYRALPNWMVPRLRDMFTCARNDELPMLVHCAAGKDRTGIAIALLLAALDVPHETIIEDYLLTNHAGNFEEFILSRQQHAQPQLGLAVANHPLLDMPFDIRQVLFAADADYLHVAFDQIKREHGSIETFLATELGISAQDLLQLRATLLV